MKRTVLYSVIGMLLSLLAIRGAVANGVGDLAKPYVLPEAITSVTPIFMDGHEGDPTRIKGFTITGNIIGGSGSSIGAFSGQIIVLNPPVNIQGPYQHGLIISTYVLPGIGSFDNTSQSVVLFSSTTATAGDVVFSWSGSISNGTGLLANAYGLSAGAGVANLFTGQGQATEVFRIRFEGF